MDKLLADLASNSPAYAILIWALVQFFRGKIHSDSEFRAMADRAERAEERLLALYQTTRRAVNVTEKVATGRAKKASRRRAR